MSDLPSGMHYVPDGKPAPVCKPGDFVFAAVGLDHAHINGMCTALIDAGATLKSVHDSDENKVAAFIKQFPMAKPAASQEAVLNDPGISMVASASIPCDRADLGIRVMQHGKDYFTDKPPLTTLEQVQRVREVAEQTGQKYSVYYSGRVHSESAVFAGQLIRDGAIGQVVNVIGMGPHRMNPVNRPNWFFHREQYGGILCDLGSHQIEQFLYFAGAKDAEIVSSRIGNYRHQEYEGFEDFGDATLLADNGATQYFRVDWFTPDGLRTWGDVRAVILGTDGYIELRSTIDIARDMEGDQVYLVNHKGEERIPVHGKVGYPFFGELILDCLNETDNAMTQQYTLRVAELSVLAQETAIAVHKSICTRL